MDGKGMERPKGVGSERKGLASSVADGPKGIGLEGMEWFGWEWKAEPRSGRKALVGTGPECSVANRTGKPWPERLGN